MALPILGKARRISPGIDSESEFNVVGNREIWFNSRTAISLSLIEARILARQWGDAAAAHAGLNPELTDQFLAILYRELAQEFRAIHAEGGTSEPGWYLSRFPGAFARTLRNLGFAVDPAQADALCGSLQKSLEE